MPYTHAIYTHLMFMVVALLAPIAPAQTQPAASSPEGRPQSSPALVAFPGAEGFGALATGGRGGDIYHVTNLNDHGPGSFRDAVSHGPRIVVFDVGGYIDLASALHVASDITIAGQTAPGEGICTQNYTFSFDGSHNVIARYFRMRMGLTHKQDKKCTLGLYESRNMILDHISIEWGRWDCIGFTKATDITLQYCLIGQGIDPQRFGCLCQSDNVTFSHNLWINNQSRNPKAKGMVQYINNVVYNWGSNGYVGGHGAEPHSADLIGNYFIKGPSSTNRFAGEFTATDHIFQADNYVDLDRDGQLNGRLALPAEFPNATIMPTPALHPTVSVAVDSAAAAYHKVVSSAGDALHRDAIDSRLIEQVESLGKTGAIIHTPEEIGGFGTIAGGPPHVIPVTDPNTVLPSGYTKIEAYLNGLAPPPNPDPPPATSPQPVPHP